MTAISLDAMGSVVMPDGSHSPIGMVFVYDTTDPLAVKVIFKPSAGVEVEWRFGRDIIADAFAEPYHWHGLQDVQARHFVAEGVFEVQLDSTDGTANILTTPGPLGDFIRRTILLVPLGTEQVDVDATIHQILTTEEAS